jgi:hypothetical protein
MRIDVTARRTFRQFFPKAFKHLRFFVAFCKSSPLIQETEGQKVTTFLFAIQLPAPPSKSAGAPAHSKTLARAPIIFAIAKPLGLRASRQVSRVLFAQRSNAERSPTAFLLVLRQARSWSAESGWKPNIQVDHPCVFEIICSIRTQPY